MPSFPWPSKISILLSRCTQNTQPLLVLLLKLLNYYFKQAIDRIGRTWGTWGIGSSSSFRTLFAISGSFYVPRPTCKTSRHLRRWWEGCNPISRSKVISKRTIKWGAVWIDTCDPTCDVDDFLRYFVQTQHVAQLAQARSTFFFRFSSQAAREWDGRGFRRNLHPRMITNPFSVKGKDRQFRPTWFHVTQYQNPVGCFDQGARKLVIHIALFVFCSEKAAQGAATW